MFNTSNEKSLGR